VQTKLEFNIELEFEFLVLMGKLKCANELKICCSLLTSYTHEWSMPVIKIELSSAQFKSCVTEELREEALLKKEKFQEPLKSKVASSSNFRKLLFFLPHHEWGFYVSRLRV